MQSIFLALVLICICTLIGLAFFKLLENKEEQSNFSLNNKILIAPITGAGILMCLSQILSIIFTMNQVANIIPIVIIYCIFILRNNFSSGFKTIFTKHITELIIGYILLIYYLYPLLTRSELSSYVYFNNDGMYYMTNIDWLQNHTLLSEFSIETMPFYETSHYILESTRFGFDILGALFASFFSIEAFQIFTLMSGAFALMAVAAITYFLKTSFGMPYKAQMVGFIIVGSAFVWNELILKQYSPQILGIGFFICFVFSLLQLYQNYKMSTFILTAFYLNATASAYAEFAGYMVFAFVIIGLIFFLKKGTFKERITRLKMPILSGIMSIIINPVGFIVAVRFNLLILTKTSAGGPNSYTPSGDPFNGNTMSIKEWLIKLIGLGKLDSNTPGTSFIWNLLFIFVCLLAVVSGICFCIILIKKHTALDWAMFGLMTTFLIIAAVYHFDRFAYGEYKHVSSIFPIFLMVSIYSIYSVFSNFSTYKNIIRVTVPSIFMIVFIISSGISSRVLYQYPLYFYDNSLLELRNAANFIPQTEPIAITSSNFSINHRIIYALKNRNIQINSPSKSSYYSWPLYSELPRYIVYDKSTPIEDRAAGTIIWENDIFLLLDSGE